MTEPERTGPLSRRRFLIAGAGASAALAAGAAGGYAGARGDQSSAAAAGGSEPPVFHPFRGAHQTGITSPVPATGLIAALDLVVESRADVVATFKALSDEIDGLMTGRPYTRRDLRFPALQTGTLGEKPTPTDLAVVVSVGASLFDERFDLAGQKPRELVKMPFLANDELDPARSHGDVLLSITADSPDATIFVLRQLLRRTRSQLVLRWTVDGFNRRAAVKPGEAPVRNLMGFKDGTANLSVDDDGSMRRHVWVGADDGEPRWAIGGSYHVVRQIRMFVENWDRTALGEQEAIIGRHRESGAPLGLSRETDLPDYTRDPRGRSIPLDAHIRLANPRTNATDANLILRRGLSYSRGFDGAGRLDQGLAFVSFQRSLQKGFLAVQARLDGEPLEEYIQAEGGGFFFALPGVSRSGGWLGESLLA